MSKDIKATKETKTIYTVLGEMQKELKAPKNQYNSFGKYKYRSCEDILEGVKDVMPEGYALIIQDEIVNIGNRFYVKATVELNCYDDRVSNVAYAREEESKKGMDGSQVTGAASSYARKYALNGLFAIDDTKDADTDEAKKQEAKTPPKQAVKPLSGEEFLMIQNGLKSATVETLNDEKIKAKAVWARASDEQRDSITKFVVDAGKRLDDIPKDFGGGSE